MEIVAQCCCGLDVHQAFVVACLLRGPSDKEQNRQMRKFPTVAQGLREMREWLSAEGCTEAGMESTGIYWLPVYVALEGAFKLTVGNAQHIRNVPGRKTDVKDAQWLAELIRHGLIRPSFVPPVPIRELRELLRYRRKLVEARTADRNRLLKVLEAAGIKLASVASDVFGVSGMRMLRALAEGGHGPEEIAELARGKLRRKLRELSLALEGCLGEAQRFLLRMQLRRLGDVDGQMAELDAEVDRRLDPYRDQHRLLTEIPGVDWYSAAVIIAETGGDMSVFPSADHLAAWTGVCPGNYQSGGRHGHGRRRRGNVHLATALVTAAVAASRAKGTYLRDKYYRLRARLGAKRAALAIAHKILIAVWHILATGTSYRDLGETYLDQLSQKRTTANLVRRLERMGHTVILAPRSPAASERADSPGTGEVLAAAS